MVDQAVATQGAVSIFLRRGLHGTKSVDLNNLLKQLRTQPLAYAGATGESRQSHT